MTAVARIELMSAIAFSSPTNIRRLGEWVELLNRRMSLVFVASLHCQCGGTRATALAVAQSSAGGQLPFFRRRSCDRGPLDSSFFLKAGGGYLGRIVSAYELHHRWPDPMNLGGPVHHTPFAIGPRRASAALNESRRCERCVMHRKRNFVDAALLDCQACRCLGSLASFFSRV